MTELYDLSSWNTQCKNGYSLEMVEDELQMKCMVDKKILEFVGVAGCGRNSSGTRMCLLTSHVQYAVSGGGGEILEGTQVLRFGWFGWCSGLWVPNKHLPAFMSQMGHCFDLISHFLILIILSELDRKKNWEFVRCVVSANVSLLTRPDQFCLCCLGSFTWKNMEHYGIRG